MTSSHIIIAENILAGIIIGLLHPSIAVSAIVSRSQTLYLKKQRGKGLVKLPWQIGSDHATIFEVLKIGFLWSTMMGNNNLLVSCLAHI